MEYMYFMKQAISGYWCLDKNGRQHFYYEVMLSFILLADKTPVKWCKILYCHVRQNVLY